MSNNNRSKDSHRAVYLMDNMTNRRMLNNFNKLY